MLWIKTIIYLVGNCSSYQEVNLKQFHLFVFAIDRYQFGIELTNASSCHCVTIINATGNFGSNLLSNTHTNRFWCNRNKQSFNQLCASNTSNLIFGSKFVRSNGNYGTSCPSTSQIPIDDGDAYSVCPEPINSSAPVSTNTFTTSPLLYFSESSSLVTSASSSSFHTLDDQTFIMATPTTSYPFNYPTMTSLPSSFSVTPTPDLSTVFLPKQNSTTYSSIYSITTAAPMKVYSSEMTVASASSITYISPSSTLFSVLSNSSPTSTLATAITPTAAAIYESHMMSQTFAHSSLTSPGASPSPTMLFCSENGTWPMTPACTMANATSNDCGNNFSHVNG